MCEEQEGIASSPWHMFSQVMGTLQGIRHSLTALLAANGSFLSAGSLFPGNADTMFSSEVYLNVTE